MPADRQSWWRGARGEWLVVAQVILIGLVFLGPKAIGGQSVFPFADACAFASGILMSGGGFLMFAAFLRLGRGLTPLPYPKAGAGLVKTGPYRLVRHPMYSGGLALCLGWALYCQSWLTLCYTAALFLLLDIKSRLEEKWLVEKFPEYTEYQKRVRKLVPFIY